MPGRTLTQHAVPTTFGLKAAGLAVAGARRAGPGPRRYGTRCPSNSAAPPAHWRPSPRTAAEDTADLHGAPSPANSASTQPLIPWHTLRTPVADLAGCLAFTAGALGKIATDVLVLGRTEIAEVTEGSGGGSSAMPHKANPVRSTLIVAAARRAPQLAATLYGSMVAEDERPAGAWHAEWEPLRDLLRLVGGAARDAAELAEGLRVHPDVMREHLGLTHGLIVSERLSAELALRAGPRPRQERCSPSSAGRTYAEGRPLHELLAEEPELKDVDLTELDRSRPIHRLRRSPHRPCSGATLTEKLLNHRAEGATSAPPLLLGPSLGTSYALWDKVAPELSVTHRVVRWDLPGHGGSAPGLIGPGATVGDLADLVLALADSLGIERFAYAGVSLGGAVGLHLAVHHPRAAVVAGRDLLVGALQRLAAVARNGPRWCGAKGLGRLVESADARWFTPGFTVPELVRDQRNADPDAYAACCDALAAFDLRDRLHGDLRTHAADRRAARTRRLRRAHLREIADAVPGAALVELPGASHLAPAAVPRGRADRPACAPRRGRRAGHGGAARGARRHARGPGAGPPDALHRPLPGLHLALRLGRDLDRPDALAAASAA